MESQDIAIGIVVSVVLGVLMFSLLKKFHFSKWQMETLHIKCSQGDIEAVKWHLDEGADLNAKDKEGMTPLHCAASSDYKEIIELLIAKGADVNAKDDDGTTPLHDAVGLPCQKEIVELLIAAGADVNAQRDDGITPLDWAEEVNEDDSPEDKTDYKELAVLIRKRGGKMNKELEAASK